VDEVDFNVDNVNLWNTATWTSDTLAYGSIAASQLLPDTQHTFSVEDNGDDVYAVLVITYRVP
jgi:ABC-type microcin C transport system permease subunit YejE